MLLQLQLQVQVQGQVPRAASQHPHRPVHAEQCQRAAVRGPPKGPPQRGMGLVVVVGAVWGQQLLQAGQDTSCPLALGTLGKYRASLSTV